MFPLAAFLLALVAPITNDGLSEYTICFAKSEETNVPFIFVVDTDENGQLFASQYTKTFDFMGKSFCDEDNRCEFSHGMGTLVFDSGDLQFAHFEKEGQTYHLTCKY